MKEQTLRAELLRLLQGDEQSVDNVIGQVDQTNQEIVSQDMVRRNQGQSDSPVNSDDLKTVNLYSDGKQNVQVTDRMLHAVGLNILTSDAIVGMVARMENLEGEYKDRVRDLENEVLKLKIELSEVRKEQDIRVSERIAEMPANNTLVLDISDGYTIEQGDHVARPMTNGRSEAVKTIHEVGMLTQQIAKNTGYNGGQNV